MKRSHIALLIPYLFIHHLYFFIFLKYMEVSHQSALLGKGESLLHRHDHDEGEEAEDVNKAATEAGDVGLIKEGADQVTEGQDAQTIVTEVQEQEEAIAVGQDAAVL